MDLLEAFWRGFKMRLQSQDDPQTSELVPGPAPVPEDPEVIKEPPMQIDGRLMQIDEFVEYVEGLTLGPPMPTRLFLHHTWRPTRASWRGYDTIMAMKRYYERQLWRDRYGRWHEGWTRGPHLFVADDGIWLFSDLACDGVGVYGHNYRSRHLEMVGNYDEQLPSGPTLENTIAALGILLGRMGLEATDLNFHRDFSTKSCPGHAVRKDWIVSLVEDWVDEYRRREEQDSPALRRTLTRMIEDQLLPVNPDAALAREAEARGLLGALTREIPLEIDDRAYVVQVFAEALLVPVDDWDAVQSLREFEDEASSETDVPRGRSGADSGDASPEMGDAPAHPMDPYPFDGLLR